LPNNVHIPFTAVGWLTHSAVIFIQSPRNL